MADQGLDTELINASYVALTDGTDNYLQLQELIVNLSHPETVEATVGGNKYFYGPGDHYIEAVILASTPEFATFMAYNKLGPGGAPIKKNWKLAYTDVSNNTKTITLTGTMAPLFRIEKQLAGGVKQRVRIRITEAVTEADVG